MGLCNLLDEHLKRRKTVKLAGKGKIKLISAQCENFEVKVKVNRQISISQESLLLKFPAEKCCVYDGEKLV